MTPVQNVKSPIGNDPFPHIHLTFDRDKLSGPRWILVQATVLVYAFFVSLSILSGGIAKTGTMSLSGLRCPPMKSPLRTFIAKNQPTITSISASVNNSAWTDAADTLPCLLPVSARNNRILHIDGDSFFASCEIALDPKLEGRPVWVGAGRRGDGIVIAANRLGQKLW
jgi:hypothetical protein